MRIPAPAIHMNGTPAGTFIQNLEEAAHHLRIASERLVNVTPHMRDYYVQDEGDANYREAQIEHGILLARIRDSLYTIERLRGDIQAQVKS